MATRSLVAIAGFVATLAAAPFTPATALDLRTDYVDRVPNEAEVVDLVKVNAPKTRRRYSLVTIDGYLDRVPDEAQVIGRLALRAPKTGNRYLLVTACQSSKRGCADLGLARWTPLRGNEAVSRLLDAPAGAAVKLTFAVYYQPLTSLLKVELDDPST
jgi:hypothetical protein